MVTCWSQYYLTDHSPVGPAVDLPEYTCVRFFLGAMFTGVVLSCVAGQQGSTVMKQYITVMKQYITVMKQYITVMKQYTQQSRHIPNTEELCTYIHIHENTHTHIHTHLVFLWSSSEV